MGDWSSVQATTGSNGLRLVHGFDTSRMRNTETGRRIDVWAVETNKFALYYWVTVQGTRMKQYRNDPKLGDLYDTRFQVLANHAIRDGFTLTTPVKLRIGSRVMRLTVGEKSYLLSGGRIYEREGN